MFTAGIRILGLASSLSIPGELLTSAGLANECLQLHPKLSAAVLDLLISPGCERICVRRSEVRCAAQLNYCVSTAGLLPVEVLVSCHRIGWRGTAHRSRGLTWERVALGSSSLAAAWTTPGG